MSAPGHPCTPIEAWVISAIEERGARGPLATARALGLSGNRFRDFLSSVDDLRSRGMIQAPVDNGTELWTVTALGRSYVDASPSYMTAALVRGVSRTT